MTQSSITIKTKRFYQKAVFVLLCVCLMGCGRHTTGGYDRSTEPVTVYPVTPPGEETGEEEHGEETDPGGDAESEDPAGKTTVTVMIYMDAATLESGEEPFASYDIEQMLAVRLSDQVKVLIQTGGTRSWSNPAISAQTTQRFQIVDGELLLVEDTGTQQDMTEAETLQEFLLFCAEEAPADRYMLILWGHGRGPQIGYGMDDFRSPQKAMALQDMAAAIRAAAAKARITIEWIGFDVCLTGNLETVYALRDCCDYLAVSEDYEPAYGWQYTRLLEALSENPALENEALSRVIVEGFMEEAARSGDRGIMAVIDMSYAEELKEAWETFGMVQNSGQTDTGAAEQTVEELIAQVWADESLLTPVPTAADGYVTDDDRYSLQDYGLTDMQAICELASCPEAEAVTKILSECIVCVESFHMARTMCGLAVCYGDT